MVRFSGILTKEPKQSIYTGKINVRNPNIAAHALYNADFKCQINPTHETFISSTKNQPYVEAHHFVPLGQQQYFKFSLDVLSNIIVLCSTCHHLLHHGTWKAKRPHLEHYLKQRQEILKENGISITLKQLKEYYRHDIAIDD